MAAQRFGLTWWGQRWISALEALGAAYANRLPRGRTYARRGAVSDLSIQAGQVTARVAGSRPNPYRVKLALPVFSDGQWATITAALSEQVRYAAALLDGHMPEDIDTVLGSCGVSLFPGARELTTRCSCPDHANPCKHVAAVHYVLAQTFDADPFLLPLLRGRHRDALLAGLRAARTGSPAPVSAEPATVDAEGVPVSALSPAMLLDSPGDLFAISVQPRPPAEAAAVLHRLGPPPGVGPAAADRLADAVRRSADRAWQLASGDAGDDPVLAELRLRGSASTETVSRLAPPRVRGEAMGLYDSSGRLGVALGSPVVGLVMDHSSPGWGFAAAGLGGLAIAGLGILCQQRSVALLPRATRTAEADGPA
ncbi:MAG: SWIM zinc finger family protein [Actinomadura sp.]